MMVVVMVELCERVGLLLFVVLLFGLFFLGVF